MDILTWLNAILKLGMPMIAASWLAFGWLYRSGEFDSNSTHKDIASRVRQVKKNTLGAENRRARFLLQKWSRFGGGFYGLAGFWTFVVIEANEVLDFVVRGGFSRLGDINLLGIIIATLIGQIGNFITAAIWFTYWPGPDESILVWMLIAFVGYRIGIEIAKGRFKLGAPKE